MVKKKHIPPLYNTPFTLIIYDSPDELQDEFKAYKFDHDISSFHGGVFWLEEKLFCVFSTEIKGYPTPGVIAHESKHLVNEIFKNIGCNLDAHNDEPECYLLGWIVDKIHETLNKKNEKNI